MWCKDYGMRCPYDPKTWEDCKAYCFEEQEEEANEAQDEETQQGY